MCTPQHNNQLLIHIYLLVVNLAIALLVMICSSHREYDTLDQGCSASRKSTFYYAANKCFYNGRESFEIVQDGKYPTYAHFHWIHASHPTKINPSSDCFFQNFVK